MVPIRQKTRFSLPQIKQALHLADFDSRAAQGRMAPIPRAVVRPPQKPGQPYRGAVLLLLFRSNNRLYLTLTKRQDNLSYHPGQICFPGGHQENKEPLQETALRETREEVGIRPQALRVLGELASVYIPPSDFIVHPFVAWHAGLPRFKPDPKEVADMIPIRLSSLLDPANRSKEERKTGSQTLTIPYFLISNHKVWGATAMILNEFLERLNAVPS